MDSKIDPYGNALLDYYHGRLKSPLLLHNNYGEPEEMPVEVFFRDEEDMPELEQYALHLCNGRILDIGSGAGAHSLVLQEAGKDVTAIEISSAACSIMKEEGVIHIENSDVFCFNPSKKYNTLLMLMNGTGIFGREENVVSSLLKLKKLLENDGQVIIDSSDISYLYEDEMPADNYFGEVEYQYEYQAQLGEKFPWLYLDQVTLINLSKQAGFSAQIVYEGDEDQYLAVLKPL